jgi:hypothetical protein
MARPRTTNKHLPKYVTVIHGAFWYRPPNGKAERICAADDLAAMYTFAAKKATPAGPVKTLNDLFDRYEREIVPTLEQRTQRDYRQHLVKLRATFGHMAPNDVIPKDIGRFLDGPARGAVLRNRQIATLSAVYTKAVGRWYEADRNPCSHVERNPTKARDRNVTDAEFAAVYKLANPRLQVAMDLALLTGQRQGDLLHMAAGDARGHYAAAGQDRQAADGRHVPDATGRPGARSGLPAAPAPRVRPTPSGRAAVHGERVQGDLAADHAPIRQGGRPAVHVPRSAGQERDGLG